MMDGWADYLCLLHNMCIKGTISSGVQNTLRATVSMFHSDTSGPSALLVQAFKMEFTDKYITLIRQTGRERHGQSGRMRQQSGAGWWMGWRAVGVGGGEAHPGEEALLSAEHQRDTPLGGPEVAAKMNRGGWRGWSNGWKGCGLYTSCMNSLSDASDEAGRNSNLSLCHISKL